MPSKQASPREGEGRSVAERMAREIIPKWTNASAGPAIGAGLEDLAPSPCRLLAGFNRLPEPLGAGGEPGPHLMPVQPHLNQHTS